MYEQLVTVAPSEVSCRNELKLRPLLNYLQDVAGDAAARFEGAPRQMAAHGYAWGLTKYELDFIGSPPVMDSVFRVRTWHCATESYNTLRVFQAETPEGEPLLWGKTAWLLLDLVTGRPVKPVAHLPKSFIEAGRPIEPDFRKVPDLGTLENLGDGPVSESVFSVRFHDLDSNGHVNNAVYFEWVYEATPLDLMLHEIVGCSAVFRTGALFGDSVRVLAKEHPNDDGLREFVYEIRSVKNNKKNSGKPLASFSAFWRRFAS